MGYKYKYLLSKIKGIHFKGMLRICAYGEEFESSSRKGRRVLYFSKTR